MLACSIICMYVCMYIYIFIENKLLQSTYKILLLGPPKAGKSALIQRFTLNQYNSSRYQPSSKVNVSVMVKVNV